MFTLENVDKRADYDLLSARTATVTDSRAQTTMKRASWQGEWRELNTAMADEIKLMASYQSSDSRELTETRTAPGLSRARCDL